MSAQSAQIVDLSAYRQARNAKQADAGAVAMPAMSAMTWVPVWFMPVYWVGTPSLSN